MDNEEIGLEVEFEKLPTCQYWKAIKICPHYLLIQTCDWREDLWAIESSYEGTCLANDDLHKLVDHLRIKLGMSKEALVELSQELRNKQ